jgi:hypothetical protein
MNNIYEIEEVEQIQTKNGQPTLMDILTELNRLQMENECLKADKQELVKNKQELLKEVNQLKLDNVILHNIIDKQNGKKEFVNNNGEGGYTKDEVITLATAYELAEKDYKF